MLQEVMLKGPIEGEGQTGEAGRKRDGPGQTRAPRARKEAGPPKVGEGGGDECWDEAPYLGQRVRKTPGSGRSARGHPVRAREPALASRRRRWNASALICTPQPAAALFDEHGARARAT